MPQLRRRVLISGHVQGVFFRQSTRQQARALGLSGWVRNLPDGRVEAVFQGPTAAVDSIVEWCRRGPPSATVSSLQVVDEQPVAEGAGFFLRSSSDEPGPASNKHQR